MSLSRLSRLRRDHQERGTEHPYCRCRRTGASVALRAPSRAGRWTAMSLGVRAPPSRTT